MDAIEAFSADLSRLADLTDDELTQLESNLMTAFDAADEGNDEASLEAIADALEQVRTEIDRRQPAEADPNAEATTAEEPAVAASAENADAADIERGNAADAAEVENDDTAEAEAEAEPDNNNTEAEETDSDADSEQEETTVASTTVKVPEDRAPVVNEDQPVNTITAGADIPGMSAGTPFKSLDQFSNAFAKRVETLSRLRGGDGEKVIVASITSQAPEDRILRAGDPVGNREKIEAVTSQKAIVAAGGFCAPLTTRYDLFTIGETARPVRDSLAGFQADRGGIRFFTSPTLNDIEIATGFWGSTEDAAYDPDDDETWKIVAGVDCPDEQTAETEAVTMALKFGVGTSRMFPEVVTANTALASVQHARLAESKLLSKIKALSTALNGPAVKYGVVRDLLLTIAQTAIWYRDRHRLDRNVTLRAILPSWIVDVMRADMIVQPPAADQRRNDLAISQSDIENFFDQWNVNVTFSLDSAVPGTNRGGFFGPLAGGNVPAFPTSMDWALFAEGSFLFLDGGTLDLGIIRDSNLVRANDYIQFEESFEGVAKLGGETLWLTSPVAVAGRYSPPIYIAGESPDPDLEAPAEG